MNNVVEFPQAVAQAVQEVRERAKAIMLSEDARLMPALANHLAFASDCDLRAALGAMKAFRKDLESRAISADATSYHERKAEAGALGLSSGPLQQTAAVDWSRIVETVNARLGPDAQ